MKFRNFSDIHIISSLVTFLFVTDTSQSFGINRSYNCLLKKGLNNNQCYATHATLFAHVSREGADFDAGSFLSNGKSAPTKKTGTSSRRNVLLSSLLVTLALPPVESATASTDPLFKPNPLTNRLLEKVRVLNQVEADNLSYDGTLAPGKAPSSYAKLLVPILEIETSLQTINQWIHQTDDFVNGLKLASDVLTNPQFEKKQFKKTFNAFGDNIYYTDPDRANLYLGGGATPSKEQSMAYLIRNDILTNVEALQAEVEYLVAENIKGGSDAGFTTDLFKYCDSALGGMKKYLALVPPEELKVAQSFIAGTPVTK
mmetsp:Transcript_18518/g.21307  ORF Transcript_18518/g.21307 Transcript_18518/m.21307 type:complete len:314 (+) Transcript_18518:83-1024(+)